MESYKNSGLTEIDLFSIAGILYENRKVNQAILFGSRAMGNYREGSDIDLALKGENLHLQDILDFYINLDDLYLPYKIDLLVYDQIKEEALRDHINKFGIVLDHPKARIKKEPIREDDI